MSVPDPILEALELESGSAYVISQSLRLTYANSAWSRFATLNGAPFLASAANSSLDVMLATSAPLRPYYRAAFARLLAGDEAWTHVYECSSSALFRIFAMDVYSLPDHAGLIVTNSLVVERAHNPENREPHLGVVSTYAQDNGLIIQCAHCRRIQRPGLLDTWDWVPVWVDCCPPTLGHGLCHPCFQHHYGAPMGLETSIEERADLLCKMDVRF
jgi:hypothetical protein